MAQSANVEINIGSKADTRGFKQAETALSKLNRSVKNVAASLGLAYGTRAIANFGKASVKAFAADDQAAKVLGQTLKNLGLGFASGSQMVNDFISRLEKQTGVLDDELRPAMDRLLRATGDITKSQELLNLTLDIAAGTGKSVAQVSQSLQKAYLGQTAALGRLGVGLSKAELTSSSFEEIQNRLTTLFKGQAVIAADSYAGSLNKLAVASNNAKEAIGKGLVDALTILGGGGAGGLQNTINLIDKASVGLETFIRRMSVGLAQVKALATGDLKGFAAIGQAELNRNKQTSGIIPAIAAELKKAAIEKAAAKRAKDQAVLTSKNTKAVKEQTALQKANALFDLNQIQLIAALKGKLSDEDRKRAELQLAILQENETAASKLAGQVAKAQGLTADLVAYYSGLPDAKNPFSGWILALDEIQKKAAELAKVINPPTPAKPIIPAMPYDGSITDPWSLGDTLPANPKDKTVGGRYGNFPISATSGGGSAVVNVTVQGSVVSQGELVDAVRNGLLNSSLDGSGSTVNRLQGSFATL